MRVVIVNPQAEGPFAVMGQPFQSRIRHIDCGALSLKRIGRRRIRRMVVIV